MPLNKDILKKLIIKKYSSYNEINKNGKVVVEVNLYDLLQLPKEQLKEVKVIMIINKKDNNEPEIDDHQLLLLIYSKVKDIEVKVISLDNRVKNLEQFKDYVLDVFKRNNLK